MGNNFNILPLHGDLQPFGSSSTHSTSVNNYADNDKAFQNLTALGSSSTHSTARVSGYVYILGLPNFNQTLDESYVCGDSLFTFATTFLEEGVLSTEAIDNGGPHIFEDYVPATDSLFTEVTTFLEEGLSSYDESGKVVPLEETVSVADQLMIIAKTFLEEGVSSGDEVAPYNGFQDTDSMSIQVQKGVYAQDSLQIGVDRYFETKDSLQIGVIPFNLPPVVDYTSPSNPFEPTIIIGGTTYSTNPSTAPDPDYVVTSDTYFVQWLNAGIAGVNACELFNFNFTLDYGGGSFSVFSQNPLGANSTFQANLGKTISVFGLTGTITNFGQRIANSQVGYITEGIFGVPNMHKQLNLLLYGNPVMFNMLTNQTLAQSSTNYWTSYGAAASAIAQAAGIKLLWNLKEVPYFEFFTSEGSNAQDALASLASQIGGTLRWDGNQTYNGCYPNFYAGLFTIPNSALITANGIDYTYLLDLETGISGTGQLAVPIYSTFDPTKNNIGGSSPDQQIQKIATVTKAYTAADPPLIVDLPLDANEVKIQILVPPGKGSVGSRYVTDSPSTWFDLGNANIAGQYVKLNNVGGAYIPQVTLDYTVFPQLAAINNGNFVLSLGVTRNDLSSAYAQAKAQNDVYQHQVLARTIGSYIKTYEATINCHFFGSIPLPGMWASATVCGTTVQGIIESVSFSYPGIISMKLAQYAHVGWIEQLSSIQANPSQF